MWAVADRHAHGHERDSSAVRAALPTVAAWGAEPPASPAEIAWALRRVGCEARLDGPEHVVLIRRGVAMARLPLQGRVRAGTLRAILKSFGVTREQLAEYLTDPGGEKDV